MVSGRFSVWLLINGIFVRPFLQFKNAATSHLWGCSKVSDSDVTQNTTGLEVIVAGLGRTGTHSVGAALDELGLRTYGTYEAVYYMREIYNRRLEAPQLASMLRSCGVKAFVIEPHNALLWKLLPYSPNATVILTTRDYESWRSAMLGNTRAGHGYANSVVLLTHVLRRLLCDWVPLAMFFSFAERGRSFAQGSMTTLLLEHCVAMPKGWTTMGMFYKPDENFLMMFHSQLYDEYNEGVRFFVPTTRLLEMDVKRHGWSELAAFLGREVPSGRSGSLPRIGVGSAHQWSLRQQANPLGVLWLWIVLASTVALNWLTFRALCALLECSSCCLRSKAKEE